MCFAPQRRALFRHLYFQEWSGPGVFCTFWLRKCASCHNGVYFFDIATSTSAPKLRCFVHFDFEICFAPQRRALFRHLNFQKWSEHVVLLTCWLRNVLRATTACNFSSLICPAGSAPAALASLLFDSPEPQIIGKPQCFATFLPFRGPGSSFFWDFLFLLLFSSLTLFSDSSHQCFSSVHIVGSLTSKLPSMTIYVKSTYLSIYPSIISKYISIYLSIDLSIYISIWLSAYLSSIHSSIYLSVYPSIHLLV